MLPWIGIALLSASWLPGLGYYHPADWPAWIVLLLGGVTLLGCTSGRLPGPRESAIAALLCLPALWVARWPYQAAFWGIVVGAAIQSWPLAVVGADGLLGWMRGKRPRSTLQSVQDSLPKWLSLAIGRASAAAVIGGCVLLAQGVALVGYEVVTSRCHELPGLLAKLLGVVAGALGMEVGVYGSDLPLFSYFHRPSLLGATWELLLDPATWCFLVGGIVLVAWRVAGEGEKGRRGEGEKGRKGDVPCHISSSPLLPFPPFPPSLLKALAWFLVPVLLWLPLRAGLLLTVYLHDVVWMELGPDLVEAPMLPMRLFWSTPLHLLLLLGPVLLAWRLGKRKAESGERRAEPSSPAPRPASPAPRPPLSAFRFPLAACLLTVAGVACFSAGLFWVPAGQPKDGRILIEDNKWPGDTLWDQTNPDKRWERTRTDKKYDTEWYGELSGYNYYCITEYARHFFSQVTALPAPRTPGAKEVEIIRPLTDALLENYDVLVLKVPGRPFADDEIDAVEKFVRSGGGLLFIGDHTNVYGHATYLNRVAERFGLRYRYDYLLGIDKPWEDYYEPPLVPHPIVQGLREMDFATSTSIAPGTSDGRGAIRSVGLKDSPPDYHAFNLEGPPIDRPEMRYGAFVQLWAMGYGRGRVAAFTDSTIFSNFCVFEPGKKELWMGMLQWLNDRNPWLDPRYPLVLAGLVLFVLSLWAAGKKGSGFRVQGSGAGRGSVREGQRDGSEPRSLNPEPFPWLALVGCGVLGWVLAVWGVRAAHASAMPPMEPLTTKTPPVEVVMDQTVCSKPLPVDGSVDVRDDGFGIFERWVLRLGYYTARLEEEPDEFHGDLLVFLHPDLPVSKQFSKRVARYVERGGKLLVVEAPNEKRLPAGLDAEIEFRGRSTTPRQIDRQKRAAQTDPQANVLLGPFGLSINYESPLSGTLTTSKGWPAVPVTDAYVVGGGQPFAWVGDKPVGTTFAWGQHGGSVTVVGFGSRFKDAGMGGTDLVEPDKLKPDESRKLKDVFQWHFGLFPAILDGTLAAP